MATPTSASTTIPRDSGLDGTLGMLRDGYAYIWNRCRRLQTDLFATRILLKPAVCIHGTEAAALFYDETKLERHHALPRRILTSLFGKNAVQTLDDDAHRIRKAAFLSLMGPASLEALTTETAEAWRAAIRRWEQMPSIILFDEAARLLTAATCAWAGVPLDEGDVPRRARDFVRMVDAFGGVGPRLWKGKLARMRTERWLREVIRAVRRGEIDAAEDSAVAVMAFHREPDGTALDVRTAAVELINVIRPTVATAWFIAFAALALHQHPSARQRIAGERPREHAGTYTDWFMQEVRRFYPFTPYLGAMVRTPFDWQGHRFEPGTLVLLDVWGLHHDPRVWQRPDEFRPERFADWRGDPFSFIPQGGGPRDRGHRCPGEWIVMHNVTLALHFLTRALTYEVVPSQDLRFGLRRMPTRPRSGFVMARVRRTPQADQDVPRLPSATAAHDSTTAPEVLVRVSR
jgi:fatty-acid peroxygenase